VPLQKLDKCCEARRVGFPAVKGFSTHSKFIGPERKRKTPVKQRAVCFKFKVIFFNLSTNFQFLRVFLFLFKKIKPYHIFLDLFMSSFFLKFKGEEMLK